MKPTALAVAACCVLGCITLFAQQGAAPAPEQEWIAPNIPGVVAGGTRVQMVAEFKGAINGPIALPDGSGILITEVAGNRITKIDNNGKVSTFLDDTNGALCLGFDPKGRLIANLTTPPGQTKIAVLFPQGQTSVLSANFDGKGFGRPNDLVVDKKGGVYFTDPGASDAQIKAGYLRVEPAVYYVTPTGRTLKIADGIPEPNGIQLSPDERVLYIGDQAGDYVVAFDVQSDGAVRNRRNFAKVEFGAAAAADGLAIDNAGRLYLSARLKNAVQIFSPQGQLLGTIPSLGPGSIAFGGPNKQTLYLTGGGGVRKIQMLARGLTDRAK